MKATVDATDVMEKIHCEGEVFRTASGGHWNHFGHIDFLLYKRSLDGMVIEPLLRERYAAGSRVVCTLLMAHYIERFYPQDYGDVFYSHLPHFAEALAAEGFYWMPIVFADAQEIMRDGTMQQQHLRRFSDALAGTINVHPSLVNEYPKNGIDPSRFTKPQDGLLWSRGSGLADAAPPRQAWDWTEFHPRRDWPKVLMGNFDGWYVKEGVLEGGHGVDRPTPCVSTEPIGFASFDQPGRRSSSPDLATVIGHTCTDWLRAGNFHSENGLRSEPWDARTTECASRFFQGMREGAQ